MIGSVAMRQILLLIIFSAFFSVSVQSKLISDAVNTQAIYGTDERQFISENSDKKIRSLSESVALIIQKDTIEKKFLNSIIKAGLLTDSTGVNLCSDEKFATHHSLNSCTGFLIAPDLVASAGHCFMSADDCANKNIVFQVQAKNETGPGYKVLKNAVYECKEIVKSGFDAMAMTDFSVIRLNKKVIDRAPLKLRRNGAISLGTSVFMIGHPLGLPQVLSSKASVNDVANEHFFKATLDSFEGNSGSPVFNAKTFEVEGILVRGEDDFVEDSAKQCYRYQTYEEAPAGSVSLKGEGVNRISDLFPL
jgi:V8-like Glu-specific endopeptidase